ncbi:phosphotransferase [Hydrogenovibrio sp. 3SP14C1]|uniref:aminoglycoside phosphotransferase family protein n=1 Tax=Hydrogenovibrio sp. 3SP14C1 TaxID=3038774 RepID=UPI0024168484|nr:phosphotransferase [Hydrogenovibrio sp. 3SP14C1]MDG4812211.1 phosphotransferase [Hydrogenovibrio sp. 3SP14C1]
MTERFQQLVSWLNTCKFLENTDYTQPEPASNDASFRRYYRISVTPNSGQSFTVIIMDAPPEHEDCEPFVRIANQLSQMGLTVPDVLEKNLQQGFLLLKDLGNETYLSRLTEQSAETLYRDALQALVTLQKKGKADAKTLPDYSVDLLTTEMNLFIDWLLTKHLDIGLSASEKQDWLKLQKHLSDSAHNQPQAYVHRDYHSRNLMVMSEGNPGILDFQDAVKGPLTYDAVSMLRDCYITWPKEQVTEWQREYFLLLTKANMLSKNDWSGFVKAMDLMGIQRHLKASGIFARLYHRDGKDGYLNDIPTTLNYLYDVGQHYPEMRSLVRLLESKVLPAMERGV